MSRYQELAFYGGPLAAASLGATLYLQGLEPQACWTAAITTLCAVWWVFEPIPLPATALIPFAGFPLVGVLAHGEVARSYGHSLVLLMLAGSVMSTAMEKSGTHRRLALGMVRLVGETQPARLVLGFLLASAVLSMWISNTATVVVLLPVALAVLDCHRGQAATLSVPLLLAVAYGAAIGGTATPIGTPPNLILISHYELATGREIGFAEWMGLGLPVVLVMLPLVWLWLVRRIPDSVEAELPTLGPWRPDERRVLVVFVMAALAWIPAGTGLHLIVDSTGLSIVGEGEWAAAKHGRRGRRGWRKLHLGVDQSGVVVVQTLTEATVDDASTGIMLIEAADGDLESVTADAAYDTVGFYDAAGARGAAVVVPPTSTANVSRHGPRSSARDRTILAVKESGRRRWKKTAGYHRQARVENAFFRYKSILGDGLRARSPAAQGTEAVLACNILNRMTELGRPMSYSISR